MFGMYFLIDMKGFKSNLLGNILYLLEGYEVFSGNFYRIRVRWLYFFYVVCIRRKEFNWIFS